MTDVTPHGLPLAAEPGLDDLDGIGVQAPMSLEWAVMVEGPVGPLDGPTGIARRIAAASRGDERRARAWLAERLQLVEEQRQSFEDLRLRLGEDDPKLLRQRRMRGRLSAEFYTVVHRYVQPWRRP